jgi:hypothetical protein
MDNLAKLLRNARSWLPVVAFIASYVVVVFWFKQVDVYHRAFETSGALVAVNNLFRVGFIFYLFSLVLAAGAALLRLFPGNTYASMGSLDRLVVGFFAGSGLWHVTMLVLGYLGLYTTPIIVALTLPAVALSYREWRMTFESVRQSAAVDWTLLHQLNSRESVLVSLRIVAAVSLLVVFIALLLVKGLYPGGGPDYFVHYFPYINAVIQRGDLWPNEVWYHYYYSKGAGLNFLSMLVTDPLASQLVTFCFICAAALALFQFLCRLAPDTLWPWVGIVLFLGLLIYTPGPPWIRAFGGWGHFEKFHEQSAALIVGILYLTAGALERSGRASFGWAFAAASAICAAIIIHITNGAYLGFVLALLVIWHVAARNWSRAIICFGLATVAGVTVVALLALHYVTTGLLNDYGILLFWRFANLEKLQQWGALPLAIIIHWVATQAANTKPLISDIILFLAMSLRLELLFPLVATGFAATAAAIMGKRAQVPLYPQVLVLAVAILVLIAVCISAGRYQSASFYRYASFVLPMMIAAGTALWAVPRMADDSCFVSTMHKSFPLVVLIACIFTAFANYGRDFSTIIANAWQFATGTYSIDQAYTIQEQDGWPAGATWGAIYPGARGARAVAGPNERVWTLHVHSYCMLPGCRLESHPHFIMTPHLDRVLFGTPEEARETLQAAGLNYFLFSRELLITDWVTLSPLFAPDNIGRYLGIRWTDDTTALLTWIGPDTKPFDENWVGDYGRAIAYYRLNYETSLTLFSYPSGTMRSIYRQLHAMPHPWGSFSLPWEGRRP